MELQGALVNALIHGDYSGNVGILVVKQPDRFVFRNPGGLRLPVAVILDGGVSDCRNRSLQKMFQLVGAGEQAGSGVPKIRRAWREQHWRIPLLREELDPEYTVLDLSMTSLLPTWAIEELDRRFGEAFRMLKETERLALATALVEKRVTNERLREITDEHPYDLTRLFRGLVERGLLTQVGAKRGTSYVLAKEGSEPLDGNSEPLREDSEPLDGNSEPLREDSEGYETLRQLAAPVARRGKVSAELVKETILMLCAERYLTLKQLAALLDRSADYLRMDYLTALVRDGRLSLRFPEEPNHPDQAYRARESTSASASAL